MNKKYTAEELKNISDEELLDVLKIFNDKKEDQFEYTADEKDILIERLKPLIEKYFFYLETMAKIGFWLSGDQASALLSANQSFIKKDWIGCKFALGIFFDYLSCDTLDFIDLTTMDYYVVCDWVEIFSNIDLTENDKNISAQIFEEIIIHEFLERMPSEGKMKMREGLKIYAPELYGLIEKSELYSEDGNKAVYLKDACDALDISEDQMAKYLKLHNSKYSIDENKKIFRLQ